MAKTIRVYDGRPSALYSGGLIAEHRNVPSEWTRRDIIERLGIASHLDVFAEDETGATVQVQHGDWRP